MASSPGGDGVVVRYTVRGPVSDSPPSSSHPAPVVTHQPLPLTGAPVGLELIGSFGLLVAGALTAWSAHRRARPARSHSSA